ncbi:unnamed protein product, partial [Ectocarpus fasciculatus]
MNERAKLRQRLSSATWPAMGTTFGSDSHARLKADIMDSMESLPDYTIRTIDLSFEAKEVFGRCLTEIYKTDSPMDEHGVAKQLKSVATASHATEGQRVHALTLMNRLVDAER